MYVFDHGLIDLQVDALSVHSLHTKGTVKCDYKCLYLCLRHEYIYTLAKTVVMISSLSEPNYPFSSTVP